MLSTAAAATASVAIKRDMASESESARALPVEGLKVYIYPKIAPGESDLKALSSEQCGS